MRLCHQICIGRCWGAQRAFWDWSVLPFSSHLGYALPLICMKHATAPAGDLEPTEGEARRSHTLRVGRYAQHFVDALQMDSNPVEYLMNKYPKVSLADCYSGFNGCSPINVNMMT